MDNWQLFGGGGLALAVIFALTKMFKELPLKKNGSDPYLGRLLELHAKTIENQGALVSNQKAMIVVLDHIDATTSDTQKIVNEVKLELRIAMERQVVSAAALERVQQKLQ